MVGSLRPLWPPLQSLPPPPIHASLGSTQTSRFHHVDHFDAVFCMAVHVLGSALVNTMGTPSSRCSSVLLHGGVQSGTLTANGLPGRRRSFGWSRRLQGTCCLRPKCRVHQPRSLRWPIPNRCTPMPLDDRHLDARKSQIRLLVFMPPSRSPRVSTRDAPTRPQHHQRPHGPPLRLGVLLERQFQRGEGVPVRPTGVLHTCKPFAVVARHAPASKSAWAMLAEEHGSLPTLGTNLQRPTSKGMERTKLLGIGAANAAATAVSGTASACPDPRPSHCVGRTDQA